MLRKYAAQAVELTQYIIEEYWQKNPQPLIEHLHENILWIGSMNEEYFHGKDIMVHRIQENVNAMPMVYLDNQEYEVVQREGSSCVVVGRYRAYTQPESGILLSEKQRVTFVWEKAPTGQKPELLIRHIHLSNVLHIQEDDERFPTKAGKENYEYMMQVIAERSQGAVVAVKDVHGFTRIVNYSDIMYLTSDRNYIHLYMSHNNEDIKVRSNLSTFSEKLPKGFLQPSRSFSINKSYVKSFDGRILTMIDGKEFRVPVIAVKRLRAYLRGDIEE